MTFQKAEDWDYEVEDQCSLCGMRGGTIFHKVYRCAATREGVKSVMPEWSWVEMQGTVNESSKFWTSAIFPHQLDVAPQPMEGFHYSVGAGDEGMNEAGLDVDEFGGAHLH